MVLPILILRVTVTELTPLLRLSWLYQLNRCITFFYSGLHNPYRQLIYSTRTTLLKVWLTISSSQVRTFKRKTWLCHWKSNYFIVKKKISRQKLFFRLYFFIKPPASAIQSSRPSIHENQALSLVLCAIA